MLQAAWSSVPETPVVEVRRSAIEESLAAYQTQMGRPPNETEALAIENQAIENAIWLEQAQALGLPQIDSVVHQRLLLNMRFLEGETDASDEELLARAFELGMDKSDTVVQRRLIDRVQAIVRAGVRAREVDEAVLEEYFAETADRWREPAMLDLTHVYFSRDKRGDAALADAETVQSRLVSAPLPAEEALSLGDPFLAGHRLRGATPNRIVARLGPDFAATAWGFLIAITTSIAARLIEGGFEARSRGLDALLERAFGAVSPGELAELTRQTQQESLETLSRDLAGFANEFNERMDRGLQRIEQSTARSANLVSQEQRGALHTVVQELSLSVRQGVEHHLSELRSALQRATEHQSSVTGGLAETFERMVENSQTQDRVARTLNDSAKSVEEAARSMSASAGTMKPVADHLSATSRSLADTSERMGDTQTVVARTAEGVRSSLEHAATGVNDQRQFIESSLGEIRCSLTGLGDGLGDSLQRSLREVDNVLGSTVGQLRDTLAESNETIERLAVPVRAAEGTTRETHQALDRVRSEVEALQQWMNTAIKPLRTGLSDVDGRVDEITRAINEFTSHTRQIDNTMESLRQEIHEESRRLQGTGSDLSRRLQLTGEAAGFLDHGSADSPPRRQEPREAERNEESSPRERSWSPAPATSTSTKTATTLNSDAAAREAGGNKEGATQKSADASATAAALVSGDRSAENAAGRANKQDEDDDAAPSFSGFRVGAPLAQGPDPFARFDKKPEEQPSNVRQFPTPDRELGDDLKLSGLLGPSRPEDEENADSATASEKKKTAGPGSKGPSSSSKRRGNSRSRTGKPSASSKKKK